MQIELSAYPSAPCRHSLQCTLISRRHTTFCSHNLLDKRHFNPPTHSSSLSVSPYYQPSHFLLHKSGEPVVLCSTPLSSKERWWWLAMWTDRYSIVTSRRQLRSKEREDPSIHILFTNKTAEHRQELVGTINDNKTLSGLTRWGWFRVLLASALSYSYLAATPKEAPRKQSIERQFCLNLSQLLLPWQMFKDIWPLILTLQWNWLWVDREGEGERGSKKGCF